MEQSCLKDSNKQKNKRAFAQIKNHDKIVENIKEKYKMANFTTANQVGKVKDLSNIVKDITPNDVPFLKSLSGEKAVNSLFNWVDKDVAVAAKGAIAEGASLSDTDADLGRTERTNYTEIFALPISISETAAATGQAGTASLAERVADKVRMISQQKETVYLSGQAASSTPSDRKTASAQAQIDASLVYTKSAGSPATFVSMTKAFLDTALEDGYSAGADIDTVYVEPSMKRVLSTLLTFSAVVREAGQGKVITDSVDIYQSDFGDVNIMIDRYINNGDILLADSSMWAECTLVPMQVKDLGEVGLSKNKLVHTESGLKHKNFKGSAVIEGVV